MPLKPEFQSQEKEDGLFAFPQGMHAGIAPAMLPKTQLGFLTNGTVRGDFPMHRPTFRKINLGFSVVQDAAVFQKGKFQGAAVFNPINAQDNLVVSISGKIFQIVPAYLDATVTNITPDTGNPIAPNQAWMFQTERWLVINDGQSIPIFVDGTQARRSNSGGYKVTVKNINDPNVGATYNSQTPVQIKASQNMAVLQTGPFCAQPGGGGLAGATSTPSAPGPGGVPPVTPPPTPPATPPTSPATTPTTPPPAPPTTQPPAHWPWLPDNTNSWVVPS